MKCCSAGLRLTAMICIWTMVLVTGCGGNRNQNDVAESVHVSQDNESADSDNESADSGNESADSDNELADSDNEAGIVTGTQADSGTDSVIVPEEQESAPAPVLQEEELITDEDTLSAVLDIVENSADQTVIEYADFTAEEFLAEVAAVYQIAHDNGYTYGDSQTMPPCEDGFISCDRLIARALWNLGMTDQPAKGMSVGNEALYLTTHGFELVTDQSQLSPGDIVMQDNGVSGIPNWRWHTFVLVSYDPETTMCEKYDCGHFTPEGKDRISSEQPFVCPLADYGSQRRFVCGFHLKQKPAE